MKLDCDRIVQETQALLKLNHDVNLQDATAQELHDSLGQAVMMAIHENWSRSKEKRATSRRAFYFSAEYLVGRMVYSNLYNLGILEEMRTAFAQRGVDLAMLEEVEDAALGNGGLGRLAACFLDSAATLNLPLSGYGLRYRFGLFKQRFEDDAQKEMIDDWTHFGDPWSYRRDKHAVRVTFADQTVIAVPYDMPIIGYGTDNIGTLRLWQCEAVHELDFEAFNAQDYYQALAEKNAADEKKENERRFSSTRALLKGYDGVKAKLDAGGVLPDSAEEYAAEYHEEYNRLHTVRRVMCLLEVIGGVLGFLCIPAAYEKSKSRFLLIAPAVASFVCAAAAETAGAVNGLGQSYAAIPVMIFAALYVLAAAPRIKSHAQA